MLVTTQVDRSPRTAEHAANPVFAELMSGSLTIGGVPVAFPGPKLGDKRSAEAEHRALIEIVGSEREVAEFTRDSVSAPFIFKVHDIAAGDKGIARVADLFFIVRASLDQVDPSNADTSALEGKTVEAGNMRFTGARIDPKELAALGIHPAHADSGKTEWYIHMIGRMLDRIHVEVTDRIVATKSKGSWLIASRTDPRFDAGKAFANRWHAISRSTGEPAGAEQVYPGGASYVHMSALTTVQDALLVEAHFAFFEPKPWFDGSPVLRSKIGVVAHDRIRSLRRELAKSREKGKGVRLRTPPAVDRGNVECQNDV
jgi:hypothetical protein